MSTSTQVPVGSTVGHGFEHPPGFDPELSAREILILQDRYLLEQLTQLTDCRATPETREEALQWVATPLVVERLVEHLGPLSFQRCCREAHGADPSIVQERVLREVAPERLAALGYE